MELRDGLVSWWGMDEESGTRADFHFNSNTLADNNTVGYVAGKFNNAADFVAANSESLSITDASQTGLSITGDYSVSCWVHLDSLPSSGNAVYVLAKSDGTDGFQVDINATGRVRAYYWDSGSQTRIYTGSSIISAGSTHHLAVSVNVASKTALIYVDGSSKSSTVSPNSATSVGTNSADVTIGDGSVYMDGWIDELAIWNRQLTTGEIGELYNSGTGVEYSDVITPYDDTYIKDHTTLSANLVSYWDFEEASGTRYDLYGPNPLTDNNTVTQGTGKIGNCADFEASNTEHLSIADGTQTGLDLNGDFSFAFWWKPESANDGSFVDKWVGSGSQRAYMFRYNNTAGDFLVDISSDGTAHAGSSGTVATGTLTNGTWYHMVLTFDLSAGTAIVYKDGTALTAMTGFDTTGIKNSTADFLLGGTGSGTVDGLLDEFGVWSKVLTQSEVDDLYNSGDGIPYYAPADIKNDTDLTTSLVSYWELEEDTTADRVDSHGSNDLTASESIARATGVRDDGDYGADFELADAEYLSIADNASLSITSDISMSAWINPETIPSSSQTILGKYSDGERAYVFSLLNPSGTHSIRGIFSNDGSGADAMSVVIPTLSAGSWYHVVATYDVSAGTFQVWLNGVYIGEETGGSETPTLADTGATFAIGSNEILDLPTQFFDGVIDETGLYSKLLPIDQIRALYGYGTPPVYEAGGGGGGFTPTPMLHMLQASGGLM